MIGQNVSITEIVCRGGLDTKAPRETKSRRIGEIGWPRGNQTDLVDRHHLTEVHLHPFFHVGRRLNAAVITIARAFLLRLRQRVELLLQLFQARADVFDLRAGDFGDDFVEFLLPRDESLPLDYQRSTFRRYSPV